MFYSPYRFGWGGGCGWGGCGNALWGWNRFYNPYWYGRNWWW